MSILVFALEDAVGSNDFVVAVSCWPGSLATFVLPTSDGAGDGAEMNQ